MQQTLLRYTFRSTSQFLVEIKSNGDALSAFSNTTVDADHVKK